MPSAVNTLTSLHAAIVATSGQTTRASFSHSTAAYSTLVRSFLDAKRLDEHVAAFRRASPGSAHTLIKVGGEVVEDELDVLVDTCGFLISSGLTPVVVHGGGPQMNKELKKRGVVPQYVKGSRVTDEATLAVCESVFTELNTRVVQAMEARGVKARAFPNGVFKSVVASPELGLVGDVVSVEANKVKQALSEGRVPVLTSLGFGDSHPALNINADVAARQLALKLQPVRVVYSSAKGGWIDDDTKRVVPLVDLSVDYERLASLNYEGRQGTLLKLNEIKVLLDGLPSEAAVTISSASGILKEIFGLAPQGEGRGTTFIKGAAAASSGKKLIRYDSIGATDTVRLARMFKDQPKSALHSTQGLADLQAGHAAVYADAEFAAGAAIVSENNAGVKGGLLKEVALLDKSFEQDLFKRVAQDYSNKGLAWKSPNASLDAVADGSVRVHGQVASYGYGSSPEAAKALLAGAASPEIAKASSWTSATASSSGAKKAEFKPTKRVGLLGARGYVGREIVKLISRHPHLELVLASSRALVGKPVAAEFGVDSTGNIPNDFLFETLEGSDVAGHARAKDVDVWILALPNGLAPNWVAPLEAVGKNANNGTGAMLIDLGADFRFTNDWTYGMPERKGQRDVLRKARRVANPGCYATGAQIALMPLLPHLAQNGSVPTVFGLSGYSGAGTSPSEKNDPTVLRDNLIPYASVGHMHERECSRHLGTQIAFMPHVAPYFQGIALTTSAHLDKSFQVKDLQAMFEEHYAGEKLVQVTPKEAPRVRDNMTKHHVAVGGFAFDPKTNRVVVHSTIDNLLKGAATQAMQNINLAMGFDEFTSILE